MHCIIVYSFQTDDYLYMYLGRYLVDTTYPVTIDKNQTQTAETRRTMKNYYVPSFEVNS